MSLRNPLQKMSKSDNQELSRIGLADPPDVVRNKVMKAVTDSTGQIMYDPAERPGVSNLMAIHSAVTGQSYDDICTRFEGKQTVDLKEELAEALVEHLRPIRSKIEQLEGNPVFVAGVLREGAEKAREMADANLKGIKKLVGLL